MIDKSLLLSTQDCQAAAELVCEALEVSRPFYFQRLLTDLLKLLQTASHSFMASTREDEPGYPASIARLSQLVDKIQRIIQPSTSLKTLLPTDTDLVSLTRLIKLGFHVADMEQLNNSRDYSEFLGLVVSLKGVVLRLCAHSGEELLFKAEEIVDSLSPLYLGILTEGK